MIICQKCGNIDISKMEFEKHIFKNNTYHIKIKCYECGNSKFIKKSKETYELTKNSRWVTDHSKSASKKRRKNFNRERKMLMSLQQKSLIN